MSHWWTHPVLLLSVGGALGTNARFWFGQWVNHWLTGGSRPDLQPPHFPWATFLINVTGSLVLGVAAAWLLHRAVDPAHRTWFLVLGTGFCGGYTTFSTFALETFDLIEKKQMAWAAAYVASSLVSALMAVAIGVMATRALRD